MGKKAEKQERPAETQVKNEAEGAQLDMDDLLNDLEEAVGLLGIMCAAMNNENFTDEILTMLRGNPVYCQFNQFGDLIDRALTAAEAALQAVTTTYDAECAAKGIA